MKIFEFKCSVFNSNKVWNHFLNFPDLFWKCFDVTRGCVCPVRLRTVLQINKVCSIQSFPFFDDPSLKNSKGDVTLPIVMVQIVGCSTFIEKNILPNSICICPNGNKVCGLSCELFGCYFFITFYIFFLSITHIKCIF